MLRIIDIVAKAWLDRRYRQVVRAKLTPEQLERYERLRNTAPELRKVEAEDGKMSAWFNHPSVTDFANDVAGLLDDLGEDAMVSATMVSGPEYGGRMVRIMVEWADQPGLLDRIAARSDQVNDLRDLYHEEIKKRRDLEERLAALEEKNA